ncbi:CLUMA_CG017235, isoform A [Clunio marinus]|uniref:CLUMA_CG017235, isoform A n=1 Tax=Clunio marinus TaxID=568069 RepID=A0A1J1IV40_9DIPT|nr:CLUMA_CG017235, isoform A [Clunio marinus]
MGVISLICGIIHIVGFADPNEPTMREPLFLVTFFSFLAISIYGISKLQLQRLNFQAEVIIASFGFILFIVTSIVSMVNVENDQHLVYMSDDAETAHPYFNINCYQSIASLIMKFLKTIR